MKLSRISTSATFFPEIDGLRFISIFLVIAFHLNGYVGGGAHRNPLNAIFSIGWSGVELFFVISGFVLSLQFINRYKNVKAAPPLRNYYIRRLTRLEPPYIIALTIYLAIKIISTRDISLINNYFSSMFYMHNIIYAKSSAILGAAWSLEVEVQFYVLMPIFGQIFRIRNSAIRRFILLLLIILSSLFSWQIGQITTITTLANFMHLFFTGLLLADLICMDGGDAMRSGRVVMQIRPAWDALGLIAASTFIIFMRSNFDAKIQVMSIFILPFFLSVMRGGVLRYILTRKLIYTLGGMCYSTYLFHTVVLRFTIEKTGAVDFIFFHLNPSQAEIAVLMLASSLVFSVSTIIFVMFERPFMDPKWAPRLKGFLENRIDAAQFAPKV